MISNYIKLITFLLIHLLTINLAKGQLKWTQEFAHSTQSKHTEDIHELSPKPGEFDLYGCQKANQNQLKQIQIGNEKKQNFIQSCLKQTNQSSLCHQVIQPDDDRLSMFRCTYGSLIPHQLIHPTESVWTYPIRGIQILKHLESKGIRTCEIYNWWRPEPYNKNIGGAAGRHPFGTAIDVDFCTKSNADRAFEELCILRKQGLLRAIGYYGGSALHLGIGDRTANTWGRECRI